PGRPAARPPAAGRRSPGRATAPPHHPTGPDPARTAADPGLRAFPDGTAPANRPESASPHASR
ncbi:hypothetical protein AB8B25_29830, partial [Streptomyces sp. BF23-30]